MQAPKSRSTSFTVGVLVTGLALFLVIAIELIPWVLNISEFPYHSVRLSVFLFFFIAAPLSHLLLGRARYNDYAWWQPFVGGFKFVALQALGWSVWSGTVLVGIACVYHGTQSVARGLFASFGLGGILSQLLVIASIHYFDSRLISAADKAKRRARLRSRSASGSADSSPALSPRVVSRVSDTENESGKSLPTAEPAAEPLLGSEGVGNVGLALTLFSLALSLMVERMDLSSVSSFSVGTLAFCSILIAIPLTHSLAGSRRYLHYKIWQPFVGGTRFVVLQALAWALWSLAILVGILRLCWFVFHVRSSREEPVGEVVDVMAMFLSYLSSQTSVTFIGASAVISQVIILLSLRYFDHQLTTQIRCLRCRDSGDGPTSPVDIRSKETESVQRGFVNHQVQRSSDHGAIFYARPRHVHREEEETEDDTPSAFEWSTADFKQLTQYLRGIDCREWLLDLRAFIVVCVIYLIPFWGFLVYAAHYWVIMNVESGVWLVALIIFVYSFTFRGRPSVTGCRSWSLLRDSKLVWSDMERYFNAALIPEAKLDKDTTYMFAFHPHGIYPMTCFWLTRGSLWRKHYGDIAVDILGASIMFFAPFLREFSLWAGGREVTRSSISCAVSQKRSIMLVPGGQKEMRRSDPSEDVMHLVTGHKGFIRMALKHGLDLVPVISFGENQILRNIRAPRMQAWTTRVIGFGLPHFPHGRWFAPIPAAYPVTVAIGKPITVPKEHTGSDSIHDSVVDQIHTQYFDSLRDLFERNKSIAGFPNCQLVYSDH